MIRMTYRAIWAALFAFSLSACGSPSDTSAANSQTSNSAQNDNLPKLGLMTSLPLYWPLDADFGDLASGASETPWQRVALEKSYALEPLDTLSPIPALKEGGEATDPLAGLEQLAVVQPRGLSPSDNVALDEWVRAGGKLLLVLDPALTGEYDLPLGDPRRPVGPALIPPVLARWGLSMSFDEAQALEAVEVALGERRILLELFGTLTVEKAAGVQCDLTAGDTVARCDVGKGRVTVLADAAVFEFPIEAREGSTPLKEGQDPLSQIMQFAFN